MLLTVDPQYDSPLSANSRLLLAIARPGGAQPDVDGKLILEAANDSLLM